MDAAARAESNRKQTHGLRLAAVISAISLPALLGINLSGVGNPYVPWLAFTMSLVTALSIAIIVFFRFGDRWLILDPPVILCELREFSY